MGNENERPSEPQTQSETPAVPQPVQDLPVDNKVMRDVYNIDHAYGDY